MVQAPDEEKTADLPRDLRFLKTLVTVLTVVMIAGVISITALLVIRLNGGTAPATIAPGDFDVPDGTGIVGLSVVDGRTILIGDDGTIRVYDTESRALVQEIPLPP
jgi:hypothetical protein